MLTLSRGGPEIWMSPQDADKIGVKDNDWIEALQPQRRRRGRAIVSHRMPAGTVFMYHAKDRTSTSRRRRPRACAAASTTRSPGCSIKPTHIVGGYAQLSYGFNYYGPTGNQRDEITVIRRRSQEVEY